MPPKRGKNPATDQGKSFMFINSSHEGINAKPSKDVRAFVMKSARNKRSWSTRPKSPSQQVQDVALEQQSSSSSQAVEPPRQQSSSAGCWRLQSGPATPTSAEFSIPSPISNYGSENSCSSSSSSRVTKRGSEIPLTPHTDVSSDFEGEENWNRPKRLQTGLSELQISIPPSLAFHKGLAIPMDAQKEQLLQSFLQNSASRLFPIDIHEPKLSSTIATNWMLECIQSSSGGAFIYAALMSSSLATGVDSSAHKLDAVHEINKTLQHPGALVSDATISAVLMLLCLEEAGLADPRLLGAAREQSMHINEMHTRALKAMIDQRGGLSALYPNRCLQICILLHSIAQCTSNFRPPYALLTNEFGQVEDYALISGGLSGSGRLPDSTIFNTVDINDNLRRILLAMTLFVTDLNSWYVSESSHVDVLELQKHSSLLMYRLYNWYQRDQIAQPERLHIIIAPDRSICLATLIFLVNAAEQNGTTHSPRLLQAVLRLREALVITPLEQWKNASTLHFWTLTMGSLGAKGLSRSNTRRSLKSFFTHQLKAAAKRLFGDDLPTADQLLRQMQSCLWITWIFDDRAKRLWSQINICCPQVTDLGYASSSDGEIMIDDEYSLGQATSSRFFGTKKQ